MDSMDATNPVDWKARELPVDHRTVTVLGSVWKVSDPWGGLDFRRAIVRDFISMFGPSCPDHHLDMPWCHPDDQPPEWGTDAYVPDCWYRIRPRRKGWRFEKVGGHWRLMRHAYRAARNDPASAVRGQDG